jgi:hypothetical protein
MALPGGSTGLSYRADDLVLWILNTGELYPEVCAARAGLLRASQTGRQGTAAFGRVVRLGVKSYRQEFPKTARFGLDVRSEVRQYLYEQTLNNPEEYAYCLNSSREYSCK